MVCPDVIKGMDKKANRKFKKHFMQVKYGKNLYRYDEPVDLALVAVSIRRRWR